MWICKLGLKCGVDRLDINDANSLMLVEQALIDKPMGGKAIWPSKTSLV